MKIQNKPLFIISIIGMIVHFLILVTLPGCGDDHNGVGQLRMTYRCNIADTPKRIDKTIYNPDTYCNREFNQLIRDLSEKCGGEVIIDESFCGVRQ